MKLKHLFFLVILVACHHGNYASAPNFILILTDDQGWTSTSTYMDTSKSESKSHYFETPNIDKLAAGGMRFSQGYAPAAICTPSRRSILYGQSAVRQGDEEGFADRYHPDKYSFLTIPKLLKLVNPDYKAAHYGKWHIQGNFSPEEAGYDESDGDTNNSGGNMFENKSDKWKKTFFSSDPKKVDYITERGINFIKRSVNSGHPFFLQLSHYATHVDIQAKEEDYDLFSNKPRGEIHEHPGYAAMLLHLDAGIGKILNYVNQMGISNNTYIFFMADNGGVEYIPPSRNKLLHPDQNKKKQRNYPLRGGKWVLYEGGVRVPFLVKGPKIEAGSQCNVPVIGYDLLPTIADLAGYNEPLPGYVDGVSIKSLIFQLPEQFTRKDQALYFHRYAGSYPHSAIIKGDYKLVKFWKNNSQINAGVEMYHLSSDMGEKDDLSTKMPQESATLEKELIEYIKSVNPELYNHLQQSIN